MIYQSKGIAIPVAIVWNEAGDFVCGKAENLEQLRDEVVPEGYVRTIVLSVLARLATISAADGNFPTNTDRRVQTPVTVNNNPTV